MSKSKKLMQLENEVSAQGYILAHQYVILNGSGGVEGSFSTLAEVERWIGHKESRQFGDAGDN